MSFFFTYFFFFCLRLFGTRKAQNNGAINRIKCQKQLRQIISMAVIYLKLKKYQKRNIFLNFKFPLS